VQVEVPRVRRRDLRPPLDDQQILGVLDFRLLGEVEAARDDGGAVEDHHFVVSYLVLRVVERGDGLLHDD